MECRQSHRCRREAALYIDLALGRGREVVVRQAGWGRSRLNKKKKGRATLARSLRWNRLPTWPAICIGGGPPDPFPSLTTWKLLNARYLVRLRPDL